MADELRPKAEALLAEAESRAWIELARGKYSQFGYWAAKSVQFRELLGLSHGPSPFRVLRDEAKQHTDGTEWEREITKDPTY